MTEQQALKTPNDKKTFDVERAQLPLHCPTAEMSLWNSHPRIFLSIKENDHATCPYCGTVFTLKNE